VAPTTLCVAASFRARDVIAEFLLLRQKERAFEGRKEVLIHLGVLDGLVVIDRICPYGQTVLRVLAHSDGDTDHVVIVRLGESCSRHEPERLIGSFDDEPEILERCDDSTYGDVPIFDLEGSCLEAADLELRVGRRQEILWRWRCGTAVEEEAPGNEQASPYASCVGSHRSSSSLDHMVCASRNTALESLAKNCW
jgi:hypothetical protein